jgi:transcriptional regulator
MRGDVLEAGATELPSAKTSDEFDPLLFYKKDGIFPSTCRSTRGTVTDARLDLPQGTLDLLILKALSLEPMHGWALSERIHQVSRETLQIPQGSLYPALHRLERQGWISASWGASDNNRRAKYYELTRAGRKQLETEAQDWDRLTTAVALVLRMS